MSLVNVVIGSTGMVGSEVLRQLRASDEIVYTIDRDKWDLRDPRPTCVFPQATYFLCAGMPYVDLCQEKPALAKQINYDAVETLLEHLSAPSRIVYFSTDWVFTDRNERFTESEAPEMANKLVYGLTKRWAEQAILSRKDLAPLVIRTSTVYDMKLGHGPKSFLSQVVAARRRIVPQALCAPTNVSDLVRQTLQLSSTRDAGPIYHVCGPITSREDFARTIIEKYDLLNPALTVKPDAIRPMNVALRSEFLPPLPAFA